MSSSCCLKQGLIELHHAWHFDVGNKHLEYMCCIAVMVLLAVYIPAPLPPQHINFLMSMQFACDVGEGLEEVRRRSIDVLQKLKRRSAAWNGPGVHVSRSESVTAWLKEGRESAQRKQEVIEVNSQLPVRIDMYSTH